MYLTENVKNFLTAANLLPTSIDIPSVEMIRNSNKITLTASSAGNSLVSTFVSNETDDNENGRLPLANLTKAASTLGEDGRLKKSGKGFSLKSGKSVVKLAALPDVETQPPANLTNVGTVLVTDILTATKNLKYAVDEKSTIPGLVFKANTAYATNRYCGGLISSNTIQVTVPVVFPLWVLKVLSSFGFAESDVVSIKENHNVIVVSCNDIVITSLKRSSNPFDLHKAINDNLADPDPHQFSVEELKQFLDQTEIIGEKTLVMDMAENAVYMTVASPSGEITGEFQIETRISSDLVDHKITLNRKFIRGMMKPRTEEKMDIVFLGDNKPIIFIFGEEKHIILPIKCA